MKIKIPIKFDISSQTMLINQKRITVLYFTEVDENERKKERKKERNEDEKKVIEIEREKQRK